MLQRLVTNSSKLISSYTVGISLHKNTLFFCSHFNNSIWHLEKQILKKKYIKLIDVVNLCCSSVSIVNFEKVNADWVCTFENGYFILFIKATSAKKMITSENI